MSHLSSQNLRERVTMFALNQFISRLGKVSATLGVALFWYESSFRNRLQLTPLFKPSFAENEAVNDNVVHVATNERKSDGVDEEEEEWETKKEQCAFCRHFLLSPCSEPFKQWSRCVDKAKADDKDFIEACTIQTKNLMECTSLNAQYFQAAFPTKDEAGDDIDDGSDESTQAPTDSSVDIEVKSGDEIKS